MTTTARTCPTCHHEDRHSEIAGCTHLNVLEDGVTHGETWCPCTDMAGWVAAMNAPLPVQSDAVIPSRRTDPETSHRAAANVSLIRAGTQRTRLLAGFAALGDLGGTDEDAMLAAQGVSPSSEYAKRSSELRESGYIAPTGDTKPGGSGHDRMVSAITDTGKAALAAIPTDAKPVGRARPTTRPTRDQVRAAISDAYYGARNEGGTMETAADQATDVIMGLFR